MFNLLKVSGRDYVSFSLQRVNFFPELIFKLFHCRGKSHKRTDISVFKEIKSRRAADFTFKTFEDGMAFLNAFSSFFFHLDKDFVGSERFLKLHELLFHLFILS